MPIEFAIPRCTSSCAEGIREKITSSLGGMRTVFDVLKAIAGADGVVIGTAEMVALAACAAPAAKAPGLPARDCVDRPGADPADERRVATQRLINMHNAWREQMVEVLARLGMSSIRELRGRSDVLCYLSEEPAGEWRNERVCRTTTGSRSQIYSGEERPIGSEPAEEGGCGSRGSPAPCR